jgi:hypothetical protein
MAIRSIEENNPDIEFDWTGILKEQGGTEPASSPRQPGQDRRSSRRPTEPRAPRAAALSGPPPWPVDPGVPPFVQPSTPAKFEATAFVPVEPDVPIEPAIPSAGDESRLDELATTPAHARLGAEGVLRLRARHAEILARISERVADATRRDELKTQAERLNPVTWVTDDEVRVGLEGYESVLESLRAVVGQGRRRRKRGGEPRIATAELPRGESSGPSGAESRGSAEPSGTDAPGSGSEPERHAARDSGTQHVSGTQHDSSSQTESSGQKDGDLDDDPEPEEEPV